MKADYEIRQETEKDYPQVFKLVEEAFRDMEESDHREQFLVERLRHSPAFVPELSLVADGDGGVVGYGLMTRVSIRSGILDAESLALAPVAVRPDRQSMGIGSALSCMHGPPGWATSRPLCWGTKGFIPVSDIGKLRTMG